MNQLKPVTIEGEGYVFLSAQKCYEMTLELAEKINKQITEGELEKPDIVVGIARGALVPVKPLADWLNIDEVATIRVVHYTDIGKRLTRPTLLESSLPRVDNRRILLLDNVAETGKTMKLADEFLMMCGVEKVTTAVLFDKNMTKDYPDLYVTRTNAWVIFYFDMVETVKFLGSKWLNKGIKLADIFSRFVSIGIPEKEVKMAMKIIFQFD